MSGPTATLSYNGAATMLNPSRIPLVLILTLSATLELLLNRIGVHLVSRPSLNGSFGVSVFDLGGSSSSTLPGPWRWASSPGPW